MPSFGTLDCEVFACPLSFFKEFCSPLFRGDLVCAFFFEIILGDFVPCGVLDCALVFIFLFLPCFVLWALHVSEKKGLSVGFDRPSPHKNVVKSKSLADA